MKKITIVFTDSRLIETVGEKVDLNLPDDVNFIQVLKKISDVTEDKFPIKDYPEYHSLLHMVWNPIEKRIYKQIGTSAYYGNRKFFDVRKNPYGVLPDGLIIYLGTGLCKTEAEEVIDYQKFKKVIQI
jgi:hypothetical protein